MSAAAFLLITSTSLPNNLYAHETERSYANKKYFSGLDHEVADIVDTFHHALENGDENTVRRILADDVIIFEGGGVERSLSEYAEHHMAADMSFLKLMQSRKLEHHIKVIGNTAVSMSRNQVKGRYKNKDIDSEGMETLLLMKNENRWEIVHIHWSN
ncbi:MAG: nuclear transport factor 2 family protein [Gammaproteobacteria bacterium]|jgi:ketosteroid isomerase-like protein|nr:nuclear transport factor 2 family protein [Gammaproteobacteria bacterium]